MDNKILIKINNSIVELNRWKINRDKKAQERAMQAGIHKPLTSEALSRAIEVLEECREIIKLK